MEYIIMVVAGIVFGALLPPTKKSVLAAFALAAFLLLGAIFFAVWFSFQPAVVASLFTLTNLEQLDRPGLVQLVGVGYAAAIGGVVIVLRLFIRKTTSE